MDEDKLTYIRDSLELAQSALAAGCTENAYDYVDQARHMAQHMLGPDDVRREPMRVASFLGMRL